MKKGFLLALVFIIALAQPTLSQTTTGLIPRQVLFEASKDEYRIRLSPNGERIYYQKRSDQEGRLFYRDTQRPGKESFLKFEGALINWQLNPFGDIIALTGNPTQKLVIWRTEGDSLQNIPFLTFDRLNILAISPRHPEILLASIISETDSLSGIYKIKTDHTAWEKISDPLPYQKVYYDQELRPKAARHTNDMGGFSILRNDGNKWHECLRFPFDESQFIGGFQDVISVSADGHTIYATDNSQTDKTVLKAISTETGTSKLIVADGKADILPFGAMVDTAGRPQMVFSVFGKARRYFPDPSIQSDFEYVDQLLSGNASFAEASTDNRKWLVRKLDGGPTTYFLFDRDRRKLTRLFSDLTDLKDYPVANRQTYTVPTRDGYELPIQVYLPPGSDADGDGIPQKALPTILYVHGGPWVGVVHWNQWFHTRNFQLLTNRGYAVINVEFRGSTGLGKHFVDLANLQWGNNMLNDKLDIAEWAVNMGIADDDKMAIWGWSYGGYATGAALSFSPETFACGIAMYAPMDLDAFSRIPFTDSELWRNRVGNPFTEEGSKQLKSQSPQYHIDSIQNPLLLTTGSKDDRVPQKQMDDFAKALEKTEKEVVYFYYPEEGHDYREPGSWISFWAVAEQFLHEYIGGRYQPIGNDLEKGNFKIRYGKDYISTLD